MMKRLARLMAMVVAGSVIVVSGNEYVTAEETEENIHPGCVEEAENKKDLMEELACDPLIEDHIIEDAGEDLIEEETEDLVEEETEDLVEEETEEETEEVIEEIGCGFDEEIEDAIEDEQPVETAEEICSFGADEEFEIRETDEVMYDAADDDVLAEEDALTEDSTLAEDDTLEEDDEFLTIEDYDTPLGLGYTQEEMEQAAQEQLLAQAAQEQQRSQENMKVTIYTSRQADTLPGDQITLTSQVEGFDDCSGIAYQWMSDKGNGFEPVAGANQETYSYTADEENMGWSWRLMVYFC